MKELREMLQKQEQMKTEVRNLLGEDKVEEAESHMEEVRKLGKKIEMQRELIEEERGTLGAAGATPAGGETQKGEQRDMAELEQRYQGVFCKALRRRNISGEERGIIREYESRAVMNEGGTDPAIPEGDSSLIVPQDIQTKINELMRELNDLSQYVQVEQVNTLSGSRVLEKDADMTPFAVVDEYGKIGETDNPNFVPVKYQVVKRAGILPITNELLADNDANLLSYVTGWISRKAVTTRNTLITGLLDTMDKRPLADLDAVKGALNVDLDPAISFNSIFLTNQDGYNWLDQQKDGAGRYLLQDDITQPGRKLLFGRPLAICSNRHLKSKNGKAPLIVGNLKQLIVLFSRKFFELASTNVGGNAFHYDTTELRTIMRDDIKFWDDGAGIFGELEIGGAPDEGEKKKS